jgi:hypothetical protein
MMETQMPKTNSMGFNLSVFKFVHIKKKDADFGPNIDSIWGNELNKINFHIRQQEQTVAL